MDTFEKRRQQLLGKGSSLSDDPFERRRKMLGSMDAEQKEMAQKTDMQLESNKIDAEKSIMSQPLPTIRNITMVQEMNEKPLPTTGYDPELPGRGLPVVGPVLRGLDYVSELPAVQKIGEVGRMLYTPGASAANVTGLYGAAESAVSKLLPGVGKPAVIQGALKGVTELPKIGGSASGELAKKMLIEGLTGAPLAAGQYLASGGTDLEEAGKQALIGSAVGAALPVAGAALKTGFESAKDLYSAAAKEVPNLGISPFAKKGGSYTNPLDTRSHIATKTKAESSTVMDKIRNFYNKTFDELQPLNRTDKKLQSELGRELKPSEKPYLLAQNSKGSDMISNHIMTERAVDPKGNVIGKSLKDITKQLPKSRTIDFEDYLINKHAVTRMERGEKVFPDEMQMTPEKSTAKVAEYEAKFPEFKQIADEYYEFQNSLVQKWLVDTGMISQESFDAMKQANPYYVPNKRVFSDLEKANKGNRAKTGYADQANPIKQTTGSERKIISPLESTIEHVDQYVKTAKRNEVMQAFYKNVNENPEAFKGIAEIVEQPEKVEDASKVLLDVDGISELLERFNENFDKTLRKPDLTHGNVLRAYVNGEPVYVRVHDPQLLEALTGLNPQAQNIVVKAAGQVTRITKLLTTGANPVFSLTRNIFRDIPTAYINSKTTNNPLRFGYDLVESVVSVLGNGELYKAYKAIGGGHSSSIASSRNMLAQSKRAILPQNNKAGIIPKALNAIENFNNAIESAPRLGEFKRLTKDGSYDSKQKALFEANDVTVNFNRSGRYAKDVDQFVPYMNAALQGLDKFVRVYKDNPVQASVKSFAAVTVPTLVLYAINHEDPAYNKLSNYLKDNFFMIPKGDGTFYKIPKPREVGVPFGSLVERVLRDWNQKDPNSFKDFSETIKTAFIPPNPLTDTIAQPFIEVAKNKNFVGAPIVPGDLEKLSKPLQYDSQTSLVSKKLGELTNQSPKQIDHIIKSYSGVIGQLGIPATAPGATVSDTLVKQVTADPTFSNDFMRDFYDKKEKLDRAQADYKATGIEGKNYDNNQRLIMNRISDQISTIRKELKKVQASEVSKEEKKAKIKELTDKMNAIAQSALQR